MMHDKTVLPLKSVSSLSVLANAYNTQEASEILSQIEHFLPYANNFPSSSAELDPSNTVAPLTVFFDIVVSNRPRNVESSTLRVAISYPKKFPQQMVQVRLLVNDPVKEYFRQPYPVMETNGYIQVESLSFLRGVQRPFPLLELLLALTEQFELEYPLASLTKRGTQPDQPPSFGSAVGAVSTLVSQDPNRNNLLHKAAKKVVIDVNVKARQYLDTRAQSLQYLQKLNESNRELQKAKSLLNKHKQELVDHLPSVSDVQILLRQLEGHMDTIEEHANCLVIEDSNQARALELMAEIHASDDMLRLLESGLKSEQLTCEDFVKLVTDIGREQFVMRFLCQQYMNQLSKGQVNLTDDHCLPLLDRVDTTPAQLLSESTSKPFSPEETLAAEFPNVDIEVIRDVLRSAGDNLSTCRTQLRDIFS